MQTAHSVLERHGIDPKALALQLSASVQRSITLLDEEDTEWIFMVRRRCRLFLMAKHAAMKKFEDVTSYPAY